MRKIVSIILVVILAISLCACETPQEKANREIAEANAAYEREKAKLDALEDELDFVQWQIEQAEKGK